MNPTIINNYYLAPAGCEPMHSLQIVSSLIWGPIASAQYFIGAFATGRPSETVAANAVFARQAIEIPRTGTLVRAWLKVGINEGATLGSAEPVAHALRFNDAVDVALPNLAYTARTQAASAVLDHVVAAGDLFALKITTPAWVTTPTLVGWHCVLHFR